MQTLAQLRAGQLQGITRLQLVEELTEFPREIFDLADTLEILDLSNNQLNTLPEDLYRLSRLKIIFASNNRFEHLPEALGRCESLEMIGFKANQIRTVTAAALPLQTRWLILTDNQIETLPAAMGDLPRLQKLALAGNRLTALPESMANCRNLELVRLSANQLQALPAWLLGLPKLTWLAFAGNPFSHTLVDPHADVATVANVTLHDIKLAEKLGEGASGIIYRGDWLNQAMVAMTGSSQIAVKLFKGEVTSDGYPADELDCCLTTGDHPSLIKVVAHISQKDQLGLVMELIPPGFSNLGLPPSLASCTRDTFHADTQFSLDEVAMMAFQLADAMAHMHAKQVSHGDVYAHNIMVNQQINLLFGDFGAASNLRNLSTVERLAMEAIEVRALGCLIEDLLAYVDASAYVSASIGPEHYRKLSAIKDECMQLDVTQRPCFAEVKKAIEALLKGK
ncbi:leucine-rich repeat-containing protein kinase family protein [Shewanella sp. SP1S2-4]|uniref:leucine-rich repeat-containing protein kinase family protein n=1 Tax=Shewanella sp. SP1S2-4 TaxID=3063537 RepID=UPI00288F0604|nr:leucine-rich repeat-containing protein kinase family protein [Shewanella sp. SP1S2-4]MDT3319785.1 leucine-rich repeat-containing protein kinase family protein [Shewanella sp. SP1S2-4]